MSTPLLNYIETLAAQVPAVAGRATYNIFTDRILADFDHRLTDEEKEKIKSARFQWWPGRKVWAAKWSVQAVDVLAELGIPEDTILDDDRPDDPESRAARYVGYAENAAESAERTAEYLETRANTERRRRLSSGKLENEVEKAEYWRQRAQGSLAWAEYRQTAPVIKRRIEGLEKDERKHLKEIKDAVVNQCYQLGQLRRKEDGKVGLFISPEKRQEAEQRAEEIKRYHQRWLDHTQMLLAFQRELYKAAGGVITDQVKPEVGGAVKYGNEWFLVEKVNKKTVQIYQPACHWNPHRKLDLENISGVKSREQYEAEQAGGFRAELCSTGAAA